VVQLITAALVFSTRFVGVLCFPTDVLFTLFFDAHARFARSLFWCFGIAVEAVTRSYHALLIRLTLAILVARSLLSCIPKNSIDIIP
jgi:hypothetical protein